MRDLHGQYMVLENGYTEMIRGQLLKNLQRTADTQRQRALDLERFTKHGGSEAFFEAIEIVIDNIDLISALDIDREVPDIVFDAAANLRSFLRANN